MTHPTEQPGPRQGASQILARGLPANTEAEQFVLGTVLLDERMLNPVSASLTANDWSITKHRRIFLAMLELHRKRSAIEALTVANQLRSEQLLDKVGGLAYLASLTDGMPRLASIDSYIRIVKDKSRLRQMILAAQHVISDCAEGSGDVSDILADAQATVLRAGSEPDRRAATSVAPEPITHWNDSALPKPLLRKYGQDDGAVLSAGEIAILSGAGGKGKSTLALQIAMAASSGTGSGYRYVAGLEIARGAAVIASYEDQGSVIRHRIRSLTDSRNPPALESIHLSEMAGHPLYGPPRTGLYTAQPEPQHPAWRLFWDKVKAISPSIVIIDPVSAAFSSEANRVEAVRQFIDALRIEARRAACGVLLIAHSTKAERSRSRSEGGAPDAGAIAGSAAWHDACRGVLALDSRSSNDHQLHLVKANYGAYWDPIPLRRNGPGPFQEPSRPQAGRPANESPGHANGDDDEWENAPY